VKLNRVHVNAAAADTACNHTPHPVVPPLRLVGLVGLVGLMGLHHTQCIVT
jgi:hypothetical protein